MSVRNEIKAQIIRAGFTINLWKQKKTKRAGCKKGHPALFFFYCGY